MRRERQGQGRNGGNGNGGGRGGRRGGNGGGGGGPRGRGGRGNNHRPRRGGGGPQRGSYDSGNSRERIAVESGALVLIDQFMLANPDFAKKFSEIIDAGAGEKDTLIQEYGGRVVEIEPGTYRIQRDPFKFSIIIHPEGEQTEGDEFQENKKAKNLGHVLVDTRCIAMIDRELLDDSSLLEKYQQLWFNGQDKACRDLLRDNGGAVRYGFSRNSDDLGVYLITDKNIVGLWPDIAEPTDGKIEEEAAA
jgi:hypothetical protein